MKIATKKLETQVKVFQERQKDLEMEQHQQELRSRSVNLRIVGLPELKDENTLELACQFLREKELMKSDQTTYDTVEIAHRVGRAASGKQLARPIIMRFFRRSDVTRILSDAKKSQLKDGDVKLARDRPKREMETRRKAYAQLKSAWNQGFPATINRNLQLVVNGKITPIKEG